NRNIVRTVLRTESRKNLSFQRISNVGRMMAAMPRVRRQRLEECDRSELRMGIRFPELLLGPRAQKHDPAPVKRVQQIERHRDRRGRPSGNSAHRASSYGLMVGVSSVTASFILM